MKETITNYISQCEICNLNKYDRKTNNIKFQETVSPNSPLEIWHMDTFSMKGHIFLTIIDKFSKYAMMEFLKDRTTSTIIETIEQIFSRKGIPKQIVFDNAGEFTSNKIKEFFSIFNIETHVTTAKSSTGNSPIERFHSTITEISRIIFYENKQIQIIPLLK